MRPRPSDDVVPADETPHEPANDALAARRGEPRALLFTTLDWEWPALLARKLRRAGCHVGALALPDHALWHTAAAAERYGFSPWRPIRSLRAAIRRFAPSFVVPTDDPAVDFLIDLHRYAVGRGTFRDDVALIERSLGAAHCFALARDKSVLLRLAQGLSIRIPATVEVRSIAELRRHAVSGKFPMVLKRDRSSGGNGVVIVHDLAEAERAFRGMRALERDPRTILKNIAAGSGVGFAMERMFPTHAAITLQQFISGSPFNRAVACWQGKVLDGITVKAIETYPPLTGPSTVVEIVRNAEIDRVVTELVATLRCTGFCGFDFVVDDVTGEPYLLELNRRATPACLIDRAGEALPDVLHDAACGLVAKAGAASPRRGQGAGVGARVALFPQEWQRMPASLYLGEAAHDVPWDEPELLLHIVARTLDPAGRSERFLRRALARR
jgi:hypothetical protein